ncbi:MAG: molybdopterin-dependent oxidoreductase [Rhizobiales bacterium]|nr:molybdopterin-dependent oxidoreductase [Hyphomicrobiales bacterium]
MSDEDKPELTGKIKEKLIASKEKTAEAGRHLTGRPDLKRENRLPPGQHLVEKWPVLDLGVQPDLDPQTWKMRIEGLVEKEIILSLADFMALPQSRSVSDIHCVTTWSRYDNQWDGVSSRSILDLVRPKADARHVIFHAYDGYTTNISLDVFAEPDVLLAHSWEGKPLTREHGGPVRAIVPQWYFWKSAKWIRRIEFSATDKPGFWEERGYHNEADPWREQRYSE